MSRALPDRIERKLREGARLEWWSLFWLSTIIVVMYFAMGSSQAMKTAWIEDTLSLIPPILYLVARKFEEKPATEAYPYGFYRVGSLAFFLAAAALTAMGGFLLYDSGRALLLQEHPTIGNVTILGTDIWLGWVMIAALVYSVIPPVILGHKKKRIAPPTMDKILYTDADMNAADWKTGLAGIVGIVGIGLGFWWADAAAAGLIAFDILRDGLRNFRIATAELLDGAPRKLDSHEIHPDATTLVDALGERYPGHRVQVRETGRFLHANLVPPDCSEGSGPDILPDDHAWRLLTLGRLVQDRENDGSQG